MNEKTKNELKTFGWTVLKAVLTGLTVFCANLFGGN